MVPRPTALQAGPAVVVATLLAATIVASGESATRSLPAPLPYDRYTLSQTAQPIEGAPTAKGFPRASILVPRAWRRTARTQGSITFRTDKAACPFTVRFSVRFVAGAPATAAEHVTAALPVPLAAYVQDEGTRGATAWRVTRLPSTPTVKGIDAMQAVATRSGISGLPAEQRAWLELTARARTAPSNPCHAGHFRAVSRQLGDAVSVSVR